MFIAPGMNVDVKELRETLDSLRASLDRAPIAFLSAGALGHDRQHITASLKHVLAQLDRIDLTAARALSGLVQEFRPQSQADALRNLFESLREGWRQFITRSLGESKLHSLVELLSSPAPDVLRILGREDDENSHSDLIAWLISPKRAPTIAKHALLALTKTFDMADEWRSRIEAAIAADLVSVRREMLIGRELAGSDDLCRVDIVVSGPGFVLAIENKVWAREHWDQTSLYWSWLEPMTCLRAGVFLSPSGLTASSSQFRPLSYIGLVSALLEGPASSPINAAEEIVLSSYLKTLKRHILPVEIKAAMDAVRATEGT